MSEPSQQPVLRVINQNATAEDIAAIVAVFSAIGGPEAEEPQVVSGWSSPSNMHRPAMPAPGPSAWVALGRR